MQLSLVYRFQDPKEFLGHVLKEKQAKNPRFSLRSWSRQLGFSSPGLLSMMLRGERRIQLGVVTQVAAGLKLAKEEARYLQVMTLLANAEQEDSKHLYSEMLKKLRPLKIKHPLDLDRFKVVSDWYHFAIYEMVTLKSFKPTPNWICKRLGGEIESLEIENAINRLVKLELLKRETCGRLTKVNLEQVRTLDDVPSEALMHHHAQMIQKSLVALKKDAVEIREFGSNTISIDSSQINRAKAAIRRFRDELAEICDQGEKDQVYQLNVQFFKLTQGGDL